MGSADSAPQLAELIHDYYDVVNDPDGGGMALGELEQVVLFAIVRLRQPSQGSLIIEEIEGRTGKSVSAGALYTVLDRLESKGYVRSWVGDSTPSRGGRRRRLYEILPEGARALQSWYEGIKELASGTRSRLERLAGEVP